MRKKIFTSIIIAVFFITTGLGCKGISAEEQAAIRPVTLEYWTVFNDVNTLRQFAAEYNQQRPYVKINIRQLRFEEFDQLFTNALADDIGPDIVSTHVHWLNKYQSRLSAMPPVVQVANVIVTGQYKQETSVTFQNYALPTPRGIQTNFVSTVGDDVIINGNVYGLPLAIDTLAIYYNKNLLDRSGVATPPTTWEEFSEAVAKSTTFGSDGRIIQSGTALGTGANIDNATDILVTLMMQKNISVSNGRFVTFADNVTRLRTNHPSFETLRFYTDFARPTKEVYSWNNTKPNALTAFTRGQSVFYIGYAFDAERIRSAAPQMNFEVIPLPQLNPNNPANIANYWVESVVKKSRHQNLAWDFIRYITSQENIKRYSQATGQPSPVRTHLAEQVEDPILGPFATQVLTAKNWYRGNNITVANQAFKELIDTYLEPAPQGDEGIKRDVNLLQQAAQTIQQTY